MKIIKSEKFIQFIDEIIFKIRHDKFCWAYCLADKILSRLAINAKKKKKY